MIPFFYDPGLFLVWCATWLAAAVLARLAFGRALAVAFPSFSYDWTAPATLLRRKGWSGRHGAHDAIVAALAAGTVTVARLECIVARPATEAVGLKQQELSADDQRLTGEMDAMLEKHRAEEAEAEARAARVAVLQEKTALLPEVVLDPHGRYFSQKTREDFAVLEAAVTKEDAEFSWVLHQLLADDDDTLSGDDIGVAEALLRRSRSWRDVPSGEQAVVRIPRQRTEAAA